VRIALDTNVIVSAVATRGLCADLLQVILAEHELVLGETVLAEVPRVLQRKLRAPPDIIDELGAYLRKQAAMVAVSTSPRAKGLDPADAAVLGEAVAGRADVLVTGDRDLLDLPKPPLKIVSPRGLWDLLRRAT
jgi:putative PIN family toxin of toxin-antitoxin system